MAEVKKIAVLFSGEGTNLENLIRHFHRRRIGHCETVVEAITNRPDAGGIIRARQAGIEPIVLDHTRYESRETFDEALVDVLKQLDPELVVLAGFMRILTPRFTRQIDAINLHPSLLPLFRGAKAIERSFASGMKVGGVTVHRVSEELDGGEILAQRCVPIAPDDSFETFHQKIRKVEYDLLPQTVQSLVCI